MACSLTAAGRPGKGSMPASSVSLANGIACQAFPDAFGTR